MKKLIDYVIVNENNEWLCSGKSETEETLQEEIKFCLEDNPNLEITVFKSNTMQIESYRK